MYLIRAECFARKGLITQAMTDLNTLMAKRWSNAVPFPTFTATDVNDAVNKILAERRKELYLRGIRFSDLKRLNLEASRSITLTRTVLGELYSLPPKDPKYVLPIPFSVIQLSGIEQNQRD